MNLPVQILLLNLVSTWFMVGLIWMVQLVHYPLFDDVGEQRFLEYQQRHQTNISYIVGPVMLIELVTAVLLIWIAPGGVRPMMVYAGVGLVVLIWASTAFIQVPCHSILVKGFDAQAYRWLVNSNWIRTVAWTVRGVTVAFMFVPVLSK